MRKKGLLQVDATAPNFYVRDVKIRNFVEICGEIARVFAYVGQKMAASAAKGKLAEVTHC